jgi:polyhydroxyalkanoate synthesis regulator phasin
MRVHRSEYFYGNKISDYGLENGYVDYRTLAKAFEGVLNNDIKDKTDGIIGYWEQESGMIDNSEEIQELNDKIAELEFDIKELEESTEKFKDVEIEELREKIEELEDEVNELEEQQNYPSEIFQYYIVDDNGARILSECNEIVFYNEELDMYVWGVTHWGTSWDYVLTDIKIELDEE